MKKAYIEVVRLANDIVTTSGGNTPDECACDFGCPMDFVQKAE